MDEKMPELKCVCLQCGIQFYRSEYDVKRGRNKYCSRACHHKSMETKIICTCHECGEQFKVAPYRHKTNRGKYCSKKCYSLAQTKMTGINNSNWKGGLVTIICLMCGKQFKRKQCQSSSMFCSTKCNGAYKSKYFRGENSPGWKGGIAPENILARNSDEYLEWKKLVYEKYNYTCVKCGSKEKPNAHHIIPFSVDKSLRFDVTNGIVLCKKCHIKEHQRLCKLRRNQYDIFT